MAWPRCLQGVVSGRPSPDPQLPLERGDGGIAAGIASMTVRPVAIRRRPGTIDASCGLLAFSKT
jgi:hypothetical protein